MELRTPLPGTTLGRRRSDSTWIPGDCSLHVDRSMTSDTPGHDGVGHDQRPYDREMPATGILIVEDDEHIGLALSGALRGQGYTVTWARTGSDALELADGSTTVVILDLGLPDIDGVDVCRQLRSGDADLHILMLTARADEVDVVVGLDAGADDYIVKPFGLAELLARIRVGERRDSRSDLIAVDDLVISVSARTVRLGGDEIKLSVKEFDLLAMLARNAGEVVTRNDLLASIWDEHWFGSTKTLDTHVWLLRRKLDRLGEPSWITTVRGVGYRVQAR